MIKRIIFIALEGGEGSGKSTQAETLTKTMKENGHHALMVHEPGTTPLGLHLREYLKSKRRIDPLAELLLFESSRAQLISEVIRPSMQAGISIVSDRFAASSIAYQGHGRHIGPEKVQAINDLATGSLYPDLNILLDLEPEVGLKRTGAPQLTMEILEAANPSRQDTPETRRFEDQPLAFHQRVRRGYQELVRQDPLHWIIVDAAQTPEVVAAKIWKKVSLLLTQE